jgi:hypothetical protein
MTSLLCSIDILSKITAVPTKQEHRPISGKFDSQIDFSLPHIGSHGVPHNHKIVQSITRIAGRSITWPLIPTGIEGQPAMDDKT